MKSKIAQRILDNTPREVEIYVEKYADMVMLISEILKLKGWSQKDLATKMNKKPSEISKWLNGDHNFTLKSICKLEAELGVSLITIPKANQYVYQTPVAEREYTVRRNENNSMTNTFLKAETKIIKMNHGSKAEKIA
jgi:transcriptional regulator with XRE-family HTH domain